MNPAYIYFKEINIDHDETFTADFSKKKKKKKKKKMKQKMLFLIKTMNME